MQYIDVTHQNYHLQGFSNDGTYMYWSFTDSVVKTTLDGTMRLQTLVSGGHLGDCDYYDGKVYASYLGFSQPGHAWNDWTSFKIYVFNASDLSVDKILDLDICYKYKASADSDPEDTRGFQGIDGISIVEDKNGKPHMYVACAVNEAEKYADNIILCFDLDGNYETEYHVTTGNTVFGIQNLDYDVKNEQFWFSTYGGSKPYMPKETLFCLDKNFNLLAKYKFSSPYGFDCLGDSYWCSITKGKNGNYLGVAYKATRDFFDSPHTEAEIIDEISNQL